MRGVRFSWAGRGDLRGSGTMLNVAVMVFMLAIAAGVAIYGHFAVAMHQARNVADLAALAGARAQGSGDAPCVAARRAAVANHGSLRSCSVVGDRSDFVVTVRVSAPLSVRIVGFRRSVTAQADAGPVR